MDPQSLQEALCSTGCIGNMLWLGADIVNCAQCAIHPDKTGHLTLPGSLTVKDGKTGWAGGIVPKHAFRRCKSIKTIIASNDVIEIGEGAFRDVGSDLKHLDLGTSVQKIGENAFCGVDNNFMRDKRMVFPPSLKKIGKNAFRRAFYMKTHVVPTTLEMDPQSLMDAFAETGCPGQNVVFWLGADIVNCAQCAIHPDKTGHLTLPGSLTVKDGKMGWADGIVPKDAFRTCKTIKTITVSNDVIEIGEGAFRDVGSDLKHLDLGTSVQKIGANAFYGYTATPTS